MTDGVSEEDFTSESFVLTEREIEVLRLLTYGLTNPQIADRLVVSKETIKSHVSSILVKLDARSRSDAVRIAISTGLVTDVSTDQ